MLAVWDCSVAFDNTHHLTRTSSSSSRRKVCAAVGFVWQLSAGHERHEDGELGVR